MAPQPSTVDWQCRQAQVQSYAIISPYAYSISDTVSSLAGGDRQLAELLQQLAAAAQLAML